jgi:octaprenyl-diphosphate synthase
LKPGQAAQLFDRKLERIIHEDLPLLKKVKKFVVQSGGKRIRPLLHYTYCQLLEYRGTTWQDVGAIGELIHAASLLHDDVVDEAAQRRGQKSINSLYGNKQAVLAGDYLLACGLDHLRTLEHAQELLGIFTKVIRGLAVGELLQLQWEKNFDLKLTEYSRIINCKTGGLFSAMTESACVLAGQTHRKESAQFGANLGWIFQVRDDYLDYFPDKTGKPPFQDFRRQLMTYPLLTLRQSLKKKDQQALKKLFHEANRQAALERLPEYLTPALKEKLRSDLEIAIHRAMHFVREYPPGNLRQLLLDQLAGLIIP